MKLRSTRPGNSLPKCHTKTKVLRRLGCQNLTDTVFFRVLWVDFRAMFASGIAGNAGPKPWEKLNKGYQNRTFRGKCGSTTTDISTTWPNHGLYTAFAKGDSGKNKGDSGKNPWFSIRHSSATFWHRNVSQKWIRWTGQAMLFRCFEASTTPTSLPKPALSYQNLIVF